MEKRVLTADSRYRRTIFFLAVVLALVGGGIIFWFQGMINEIVALAETDPATAVRRTHRVFTVLMGCFGLSLMAFGIYLLQFAVRILRSGEMPPPGTRVLRDVPVRTGRAAILRARILLFLAVLLGLAGGIVPVWMERQFRRAFDIPAVYPQLESPGPLPGAPPQPEAPV